MHRTLFPTDLPDREWSEFSADGFRTPVCGGIHRGSRPPVCGLPLGGIDTGCLDLEVTGLMGYCTIFNSLIPRRGPLNLPFLGVSVGKRTWVCTTQDMRQRNDITWFNLLGQATFFRGAQSAKEIQYWGHYPVADMEFELANAPVSVGLRAWSPFIPGDVAASNTPGAVFEVHLRSQSEQDLKGTLAFSFPGPSEGEADTTSFERCAVDGEINGVAVLSGQASYVLAAIRELQVRTGGALHMEGTAWEIIEQELPYAEHQAGASLAVDFALAAGEEKIVRFVLAWHSPTWMGGGTMTAGSNAYTHMYAWRHPSAEAAARFLASSHEKLLARVLAWQSVIYNEIESPAWLRDTLVNILHLITETSVWGQAKPPIGDWCRPEDGLFGMSESPRWCPQIECIPCSFYGNLPLVYFFPELALSTLRGYKAYQYPSGAAPWVFGGCTVGSPPYELAMPSPGYANKPQTTLDGPCFVEMVDKMWQRTGDRAILDEFYEPVKRNTIFTMNLRPGSGPAGVVSMPADNNAFDWYEFCDLFGIVPHIGGAHLAQLRMAKRMAEAVGDASFAGQCQDWLEQGSAVLESHGWGEDAYLLYHELESGKHSNVILAHQLDGEWMARFHGLPGVFQDERVAAALETIKRTNISRSSYGAAVFAFPEGKTGEESAFGYWTLRGVHPPGTFMLAMLYLYRGQVEFGLDLARRTVQEIIRRGWVWDWPVVLDGDVGPRIGFDYYQNLMFWSLPAVLAGGDLTTPCKEGGLVERVIAAGRGNFIADCAD